MRTLLVSVLALAAATPVSAQQSGLLLGFATDSGYRTLWIAPAGGRLKVAAEQRGLIIPRADGFHHVDVARSCTIEDRRGSESGSGMFVNEYDAVIDRPLGATVDAAADSTTMACATAEHLVTAWQDSVSRADSLAMTLARTRGDSTRAEAPYFGESDVCGFSHIHITWLSPRYRSTFTREGQTEYCEPAGYTTSDSRGVFRADSAAQLALRPLLSAAAWRRLVARWERQKGGCATQDSPDYGWGIVRGNGRWRLAFATSGSNACRGLSGNEESGFHIDEAAPASLARRDPAARWRPLLAAQTTTTVDDVFAAAAGDLVAARSGDRLLLYTPRGGQLGDPVLTVVLRPQEQVVMAEWATGKYVDRWTSQLTGLRERW
ncbi:MAG: hypothetical protein ACJ79K_07585 [Gemmatimonadaceae bacterium]